MNYINAATLQAPLAREAGAAVQYQSFEDLLTNQGHANLVAGFPRLDQFEKHEGLPRANGQRPHDRYYLGYKTSPYHPAGYRGAGIAYPEDLSPHWQSFLSELESDAYREFLTERLGTEAFTLHCAWHMGMTGGEVSPHKDTLRKLSIHLFYFNPVESWDEAWGGQFLILNGRKVAREDPDFSDFEEVIPVQTQGNRSLLMRNGQEAWHGVKPLNCPEGQYRRVFTVIAKTPVTTGRKLVLFARRTLGMSYPGES